MEQLKRWFPKPLAAKEIPKLTYGERVGGWVKKIEEKRWLGGSSIANLAEWQRISTGKVLALLGLQGENGNADGMNANYWAVRSYLTVDICFT
jgi:hypothetical protein